MRLLATADLHLKPESADTVFAVLDHVAALAAAQNAEIALLGDIYDERYSLPVALQNRLMDWVLRLPVTLHILPGNHDQESASGRHALEVFAGYPNVNVYTEPTRNELGTWLPYRKDVSELTDYIATSPAGGVAYLHHGIVGALMNSHVVAGEFDGLHPDSLAGFATVYAGHWHRHQAIQNIVYCGSPWQTRADEAGQKKGVLQINGPAWSFIPLDIGPRHFNVRARADGAVFLPPGLSERDHVHVTVPDGADTHRTLADLADTPAAVRVKSKPKASVPRLQTAGREPADIARAYVASNSEAADRDALLQMFETIRSAP